MKKVFSLLLSLTMVMALLAGCGGDTTTDTADDSTTIRPIPPRPRS